MLGGWWERPAASVRSRRGSGATPVSRSPRVRILSVSRSPRVPVPFRVPVPRVPPHPAPSVPRSRPEPPPEPRCPIPPAL